MTWKKWALNPTTTSLVVSLFWWAVAHVFHPLHPQASGIQVSSSHFAFCLCLHGHVLRY